MATLFQRVKGGPWYLRFQNDAREWNQRSLGKISKEDAEAVALNQTLIERNRRHDIPVVIIKSNLIEQLIRYRDKEIFRSNEGRKKAKATIIRYQQTINNFIEYVEAHEWKEFGDVTKERIRDFIDYLTDNQSPSSCILHRLELIKFFKWAIGQCLTKENPMTNTKNPPMDKNIEPPFFFSAAQLSDIFENAHGVYKNIFRFLYLTGMRIGELCNSEYSWLRVMENPEDDTSLTTLNLPKNTDQCKTKRGRSISLNQEALEIITDQKRESLKVNTSDAKKFIFINMKGDQLDNANIYRNLKKVLKKCNISGGHPHSFRHTFASHLAMKGTDLRTIMELMGHKDMDEVLIYAHVSAGHANNAVNKLSTPATEPRFNLRKFKLQPLAAGMR